MGILKSSSRTDISDIQHPHLKKVLNMCFPTFQTIVSALCLK